MQTIGERLEEARKKRGISLREAAESTKIRGDFLQSFENNQWDIGLPDLYVRGFLRNYAAYLHLPVEKISADFLAAINPAPAGRGGRDRPREREDYGRYEVRDGAGGDEEGGAASPSGTGDGAGTFDAPAITRIVLAVTGAIALVALAVYFGLAFLGGDDPVPTSGGGRPGGAGPAALQPVDPAVEEKTIALVARDTVYVNVTVRATGEVLFAGTLLRDDRREVPLSGGLDVEANPAANLIIEKDGQRLRIPGEGRRTGRID